MQAPEAKADKPKKQMRRRSTFDGLEGGDPSKRGKAYGNMVSPLGGGLGTTHANGFSAWQALLFNTMQTKMLACQQSYLAEIRDTIGCELVQILFFNDQSRELMLCIDEKWYRVPCESGIEGWCVVTGETINLEDAYRDHRFNGCVQMVPCHMEMEGANCSVCVVVL